MPATSIAIDRGSHRFKAFSPSSVEASTILLYTVVLVDILLRGRLYVFAPPIFRTALIGFMVLTLLLGAVRAWFTMQLAVSVFFTLMVSLFFWELYRFSAFSGREMNPNAIGQLYGPASFVFFAGYPKDRLLRQYANAILVFGIGYAVVYFGLAVLNYTGHLSRSVVEQLASNDSERGQRVIIAADILTLVFYLCITGYYRGRAAKLVALLVLVDIGFALTRYFTAVFLLALLLDRLRLPKWVLPTVCWLMFLVPSVLMVYGLYDHSFNPFSTFSRDTSGGIRSAEYEIARWTILLDPIWGVGFPSSDTDLAFSVSSAIYSTSDIGLINIWSIFGVFGMLTFLFSGVPLTQAFQGKAADPSDESLRRSYHVNGCIIVADNAIAPLSFVNPGSLVFGIALALWLKKRDIKWEKPFRRKVTRV